ncbi:MAG: hypothetical protein ACR2RE_00480 [Geminicoccaceae bacterium]
MTVEHWNAVKEARVAFEAQWQPSSLAAVDGSFYERFMEQVDLWNEAYANGSTDDIETHAGGMIRAYQAAAERLKGHRMTAYMIGYDRERGIAVCVSAHSESLEFAKKHVDGPITWVTPESVARLVAQAQDMGVTIMDTEDRLS